MKAAMCEKFQEPLQIVRCEDPAPVLEGVVLDMIESGKLAPARLVGATTTLASAAAGFTDGRYLQGGAMTVIDRFT